MAAGKRIFLLLGNPLQESFCGEIADEYERIAKDSGFSVRRFNLGNMQFDPILHAGYQRPQPLEDDLQKAQEAIQWADHLVFVFPTWWASMPALLKGFIDRVFLPGFGFKFPSNSMRWERLLTGKTARLIVTSDCPAWVYRWIYSSPGVKILKKSVCEFCGIKPVKTTHFGNVRLQKAQKKEIWLQKVRVLARLGI